MRFTDIGINFDVTYEGHWNLWKIEKYVLRIFWRFLVTIICDVKIDVNVWNSLNIAEIFLEIFPEVKSILIPDLHLLLSFYSCPNTASLLRRLYWSGTKDLLSGQKNSKLSTFPENIQLMDISLFQWIMTHQQFWRKFSLKSENIVK